MIICLLIYLYFVRLFNKSSYYLAEAGLKLAIFLLPSTETVGTYTTPNKLFWLWKMNSYCSEYEYEKLKRRKWIWNWKDLSKYLTQSSYWIRSLIAYWLNQWRKDEFICSNTKAFILIYYFKHHLQSLQDQKDCLGSKCELI
jgi:hypothetical protein